MIYDLPISININGKDYLIRNKGDYRVVLDVITALNDPNLKDYEKALCILVIFYEKYNQIKPKNKKEAVEKAMEFISYSIKGNNDNAIKLMDWEQDFPLIVAPINRVIGTEIRALEYLHWFTFLSAYLEIGECSFQFIVGIRSKLLKGEKLEKYERKFLRENEELVKFDFDLNEEEKAILDSIV